MTFASINPATGDEFERYEQMSDGALDAAVDRARKGFAVWSRMTVAERAKVLGAFGDRIESSKRPLAEMMTREMGKPITQSTAEAEKCAVLCHHFAEKAEEYLAPEQVSLAEADATIRSDPLGTLFSVTPWNFPMWQLVRAAVPAFAAGNTVVVKPAPNVIGSALMTIDLLREAGAPEGLYECLVIDHDQSARLIADDRISGVALTGSERAGSAVASTAGQNLKKVVLELGGSDPFIVLADADMAAAAKMGAKARFQNSGQVCVAAKRFIVEEAAYDAFRTAFAAAVDELAVGDPMAADTFIGPMARADLRDEVDRQTRQSIEAGAGVVLRGGPAESPGFFYRPTVLEGGTDNMPARRQEIFGPTALLIKAKDADDAVRLANDTRYGLSANLWTRDIDRAHELAARIEAGGVFINSMTRSHPALPFGGIKMSGFGRELGREGMREFVNLKTVWVEK